MKTSVLAFSGLALAVLSGISTTGCKVTHYGPPAGQPALNEEAVCRATCEDLIDRQAISGDGAKECLASCGSRRSAKPAKPAKPAKAPPAVAIVIEEDREARAPADVEEEESACPDAAGDRADEPCRSRRGPSCGCGKSQRRADGRCRKETPAPPRPPEPPAAPPSPSTACQSDRECPEDTICDSGVCR